MFRASLSSLLVVAVLSMAAARADDAKKKERSKHHIHATVSKIDSQKNTLTAKVMNKDGKEEEKTFTLSDDAKYLDTSGEKIKADTLKAGDEVCLVEKDDKIVKIRKEAQAKITKVDAKAGTITVKTKDKSGKDVEKTFRLVEDSEYIDSNGNVAVLDVFRSGDEILFIEADGTIESLKKSPQKSASKDKDKSANK